MNEATVIKTIELPHGQDWALYADANVVVLSPRLDPCGRDRAIDEVCAHWRRSTLPLAPVDDAATGIVAAGELRLS